jgi:hypothetical protein
VTLSANKVVVHLRMALRVAGSWIAAIAALVLALCWKVG